MVLTGQESGVTPLVLAKGIDNTASGSGNATNNNLALDWASALDNMDLGWVNGLAYNMEYGNMEWGLARETMSLVWERGIVSSMGLVLANGTSMVTSGENKQCSQKLVLIWLVS